MKINDVLIEDTFAEIFSMYTARILITATTRRWALESALETKGLGRSATLPPSEASIERAASGTETPDTRPGYILQVGDRKREEFKHWLVTRIRKGVFPIPTTAVFNALPQEMAEDFVDMENTPVQLFGDGYEEIVEIFGRKMYKIPRMDGFLYVEKKLGVTKGVAGGNFLIMGDSQGATLLAAETALEAIMEVPYVTGRIAASGTKVGGKLYKDAVATTNDPYCACISDKVKNSKIPDGVHCVYEMIINGLSLEHVKKAMKAGVEKAVSVRGVKKITAGNYGGKLGKERIYLHDLMR
ncbi:MAG: Formylmethanofuran--tetrahydromethanopterin formyltransferase [Candidatus Bathyarchaeota archaeon BA1]|nr:MAG: Formylmethanofuran--tetrahydromethanopterin formyltransferase [Candidatus Bathyarchaeota archaeon BA1]